MSDNATNVPMEPVEVEGEMGTEGVQPEEVEEGENGEETIAPEEETPAE